MLLCEGEADDADAEQDCEDQVDDRDPDPADQDPDDVHDDGEGCRRLMFVHYFFSEGQEAEKGQLDALHAEGDADDGDAENQSADQIAQEHEKSSEDDPE